MSDDLCRLLLDASWRASHEEPVPKVDVSGTLEGATLHVQLPGGRLSGHLGELSTFLERVWWRLGHANRRFPTKSSPAVLTDVLDSTYANASPALMALGLPDPERALILGLIRTCREPEPMRVAAEALDAIPPAVRANILADDLGTFTSRLFDGRKRAADKFLIAQSVKLFDDPRPLQRRAALISCAAHLQRESYAAPSTIEASAKPALVGLDDPSPAVREAALVVVEFLGHFLMHQHSYAAALPYLDIGVERGPSFAARYESRFRALLALGRTEEALADQAVFARAMRPLYADQLAVEHALALHHIDVLLCAARSCDFQRRGLPTSEARRLSYEAFYKKSPWRAPKPVKVPAAEQDRLHAAMRAYAREAQERLDALGANNFNRVMSFGFPTRFPMEIICLDDPARIKPLLDTLSGPPATRYPGRSPTS